MPQYILEREGQLDFYNRFLPRVDPTVTVDELLVDNTDGVLNGNLLEFKLNIADLNAVLLQSIKYLSAMRVKGKPVPANILLVDLNAGTAWLYRSAPYLDHIEKLYSGGASKDNTGFVGGNAEQVFRYEENALDAEALISILKERNYTKIHIDENCVVGWATSFYQLVPNARKEDFLGDDTGKHKTIGEIRRPVHFAEYIYPYTGETNVKFNYLMDKLNDFLQKKNLGAFYTPKLYAQKSVELVREAIARVPQGNDYIILDRCAGTGNLESYLEKLPMFAASRYITYNREWTERARIMKSADGAERFARDVKNGKLTQFLLKCLLFTCLEMQNHMRTFTGSDGRFYRNELCLDTTNGETLASADISKLNTNDREKELLHQWEQVLHYARQSDNYDPAITYGVYQIFTELDTSHKDEKTGDTVWENIELHTALQALKSLIKAYYNEEIVPALFEYEFLK